MQLNWLQHTEKTKEPTLVEMSKVLEKGDTRVATIKYKQSGTEKQGMYAFGGRAAT